MELWIQPVSSHYSAITPFFPPELCSQPWLIHSVVCVCNIWLHISMRGKLFPFHFRFTTSGDVISGDTTSGDVISSDVTAPHCSPSNAVWAVLIYYFHAIICPSWIVQSAWLIDSVVCVCNIWLHFLCSFVCLFFFVNKILFFIRGFLRPHRKTTLFMGLRELYEQTLYELDLQRH
jgi:hypothetical protein